MKRIAKSLVAAAVTGVALTGTVVATTAPAQAVSDLCGPGYGYKQIGTKKIHRGKAVAGTLYIYGKKYAKGKYKTKHWWNTCIIAKPNASLRGKVSHLQAEMFKMDNAGTIKHYRADGPGKNYHYVAGPVYMNTYGYAQSAVVKNASLTYKGKRYST
ncbi:hypothetical protein J4573_31715 [Actinomadura barringtoniae]|uniref:Uncharacterized protein n=1 Tax=Actinomadura barringtoniae TaxID=1427535 RepID=A0A939PN94_9ACTN|nr:hypothetical protein [Actinomadura barringtoniae]MBO2451696.1 hypothetical protein [Actinomadura barringtoniae]